MLHVASRVTRLGVGGVLAAGAIVPLLAPAPALAQVTIARGTVLLSVRWTDRAGGVHPVAFAAVTGFERDTLVDDNAGAGFLGIGGTFSFSGTDTGPFESQTEFSGGLQSVFGSGAATWFRIVDGAGAEYSGTWPAGGGTVVVTDPEPFNPFGTGGLVGSTFTFDNTTAMGRGMAIAQFVGHIRAWAADSLGAAVPTFRIEYPSARAAQLGFPVTEYEGPDFELEPLGTTGSYRIRLPDAEFVSSSNIMHEVGHVLLRRNGLSNSPGGAHAAGTDAIRTRGASGGSRLAWSEGLCNALALLAVHDGAMAQRPNLANLPAAEYDTWYDLFTPTANATAADLRDLLTSFDLETNRARTGRLDGTAAMTVFDAAGEGDELAVARVLWDFFDRGVENVIYTDGAATRPWAHGSSDRIHFSARDIWGMARGQPAPGIGDSATNQTLHQFWRDAILTVLAPAYRVNIDGLRTSEFPEAVAAMGEVLSANGVAATPITAGTVENPALRLTWSSEGGGNSSMYRILIYSSDWTRLVLDSGALQGLGANLAFDVNTLIEPGQYRWVVLNNPAMLAGNDILRDPFHWYWSGAAPLDLRVAVPAPGAAAVLMLGAAAALRRRR